MEKKTPSDGQRMMIENFQCIGCVAGPIDTCLEFVEEGGPFWCKAHVAGTTCFPGGRFYLGLPKGFCKVGGDPKEVTGRRGNIRLWLKGKHPEWNDLNVPVWAMSHEGYLLVRTYLPRLDISFVDVIPGGRLELCGAARSVPMNVGTFYEEID